MPPGIRASVGPSEPLPPESAYFTLQDFKVRNLKWLYHRQVFNTFPSPSVVLLHGTIADSSGWVSRDYSGSRLFYICGRFVYHFVCQVSQNAFSVTSLADLSKRYV